MGQSGKKKEIKRRQKPIRVDVFIPWSDAESNKRSKPLVLHAAALVTHTQARYGSEGAPSALKKQFSLIWLSVTELLKGDIYILQFIILIF